MEEAAEAVGGDGFDVIIENASDINLGSDLTVIGPGARVVVILSPNSMEIYPNFNQISSQSRWKQRKSTMVHRIIRFDRLIKPFTSFQLFAIDQRNVSQDSQK